MQMFTEGAFWVALSEIIVVNIVLSGDNAVVIALACRNLPPKYRQPAIMAGSAGAIVLRIVFCVIVAWLLKIPYLKVAGALLLFWIGIKLITQEDESNGEGAVAGKTGLWGAIQTIVIADAVMSLDNAIAIAAAAEQAAHGDNVRAWILIGIGLVISIPIIVFGSTIIMRVMQRWPAVILIGGALLGFVAGEMIPTDPAIHHWLEARVPEWFQTSLRPQSEPFNSWLKGRLHTIELVCGGIGAAFTLAVGLWLRRRAAAKEHALVDLAADAKKE